MKNSLLFLFTFEIVMLYKSVRLQKLTQQIVYDIKT